MKMTAFLVRLVLTLIVASPVVYWSWDVVSTTTAEDIMLSAIIIVAYGVMVTLLYCFVSALTKLLQHDNKSS
ncbi:TPA: conjugal transfer protein TrbE [Salmonella enterica subsp. enterica serovar Birkenhead]|uniref:conjugal transfer protein TrbE n=1 Tax=Salmonella enterica TaxID=28901 RepID=UPI00107B313E|nr:conjugal transfer protein TrbE [Salmonella enterica]EAB6033245.1 conjugal transfer protein TrbE [Salmonella enterica subsp. enterica serovar Java]EBI0041163.1 conjugal transfer protein TrbE [Salmonella enterica subsp. diarizonae serovar 61:k:z35]ECD9254302.1 conjugal transfer protein TrbE [Salmonella enterica subsp. diarizonae]ECT8549834.1 conjugal transfer protein TrbE [Salmonella enterica subsp. diarizonae serovar 48:i:z]EIC4421515.1 conjugal transfer protein TrbE [Salmonella enterica sub